MRFRGDDDSGIARTNGRANKTSYLGDHEVIALVELNDVSVLIALAPSGERIGHIRHLCRAGFQRLKLAHKLFPSPSFRSSSNLARAEFSHRHAQKAVQGIP